MKQIIEIEVPEGKKAIWEDGQIRFVSTESWKDITTFEKALDYLKRNHLRSDLVKDYYDCNSESYAESVIKYQIVVTALTNNEKRHLTTGDRWYPTVQFCRPKDKKNCWGNEVVGTIESEGERYLVVGGPAYRSGHAGLGCFHSAYGASLSYASVGFRSVSSQEIAEHISKYFGRLLFEIHYGGTNCDWKWMD